ncbi:hypothetical protein B5X24_HaOG217064 [Helicoverpa armigera]|uniref:Uncharacterized protein n=1 Tax=Helicoverpa armigera TaxID=29058 RepID=A0A2W1C168_HELAM|nr:hypothetical protein B5X24_HaOG217064 [Helicoverpa armigera]
MVLDDLDTSGGWRERPGVGANRCVAMATATSAEEPALYCPFLSRLDIISHAPYKKTTLSTAEPQAVANRTVLILRWKMADTETYQCVIDRHLIIEESVLCCHCGGDAVQSGGEAPPRASSFNCFHSVGTVDAEFNLVSFKEDSFNRIKKPLKRLQLLRNGY